MDGLELRLPGPQWADSLSHLELSRACFPSTEADRNSHLVAVTAQCPLLVHLHLDLSWMYTPGRRFHIPSLNFLHISVSDTEDEFYLRGIIDLFDTPALTEFIIDGTHGDQICVLFNLTSLPHSSFPALTSFSFVKRGSCWCDSEPISDTISSPPLHLFPALSSLTLINQCSTPKLVQNILGPASQPWPLLKTVALWPRQDDLEALRDVLRDAVQSKRERGQALPKFRLSPKLLSQEDWQGMGVDVEILYLVDDPDGFHMHLS
jgi:hypothetical protein